MNVPASTWKVYEKIGIILLHLNIILKLLICQAKKLYISHTFQLTLNKYSSLFYVDFI